jgi:membrane-bound lytic murein transglycosylase B
MPRRRRRPPSPRRRRRRPLPRRATPAAANDAWLAAFEREALAQGISQRTIAAAAPSLTYDQKIVYIDRGQRVFTQTFLEFSGRMAAACRIQRGQALIQSNAATFARIEQQFGVPAPVIVSFWGLESDFGANMGNYRSLSAIASLAYDAVGIQSIRRRLRRRRQAQSPAQRSRRARIDC